MAGIQAGHAAGSLESLAQILKRPGGKDVSQPGGPVCKSGCLNKFKPGDSIGAAELARKVKQRDRLVGMPGRPDPVCQYLDQGLIIRLKPKKVAGL